MGRTLRSVMVGILFAGLCIAAIPSFAEAERGPTTPRSRRRRRVRLRTSSHVLTVGAEGRRAGAPGREVRGVRVPHEGAERREAKDAGRGEGEEAREARDAGEARDADVGPPNPASSSRASGLRYR